MEGTVLINKMEGTVHLLMASQLADVKSTVLDDGTSTQLLQVGLFNAERSFAGKTSTQTAAACKTSPQAAAAWLFNVERSFAGKTSTQAAAACKTSPQAAAAWLFNAEHFSACMTSMQAAEAN